MKEKKVKTPIDDFVREYCEKGVSRFHMPGHKGQSFLGCESLDITEISGADVLYSPDGIIEQSENIASELFGTAHTFYSAEGSSLCIKAMLALAISGVKGKKKILAARNAHKAFVYGCALLDIEIIWMYPSEKTSLCSVRVCADEVRAAIEENPDVCAVYLTSPDYLGNIADISEISRVCDEFSIPLLVDNAHGAYLKFMHNDAHPITLGAYACCDSAHKTLPVLTGGAYLHISKKADDEYVKNARNMLSVFASTSPSYLILQSLDICNRYLSQDFSDKLKICIERTDRIKKSLRKKGFVLSGDEKLKIVIDAKKSGYSSFELEDILRENLVECEFSDGDFLVLMASCENSEQDFLRIEKAFEAISAKEPICEESLFPTPCKRATDVRGAIFAAREKIKVDDSVGKICGCPAVSCPPAIPIVTSGEIIDENAVRLFKKYGIYEIDVVKI